MFPLTDTFKPHLHQAHGWQSVARIYIAHEWPQMCLLCKWESNKPTSIRVERLIDMQYAKWALYGITQRGLWEPVGSWDMCRASHWLPQADVIDSTHSARIASESPATI